MVDTGSNSALTRALDDLEDAQDDLARYKRGVRFSVTGLLTSVFMVVTGAVIGSFGSSIGVDTGGVAGALCGIGGAGILAAVGFGVWWFYWNHTYKQEYSVYRESGPSPKQRLRAAERAYRNVTMEDV